ncbi:MAG: XrtA/PEP-CTERM system TPR-repeat protein PrsT [Betaproteobacteria bacterium]
MRHKPLPRSLLAGALVVLAACGADPSAQQLLDAARAHLDKGEPAAAVIELKRALDKEPQSAQARQWLGKALLAKGDVAGAVVELQKARELGLPAERVVLDLARAYLANGQSIQAVLELRGMKLADPKEQAELLTLQAAALTAQRQPGEARALLDEALLLTPDYAPAVVARAQLDAADGRLDEALTKVDALWTRDKTLAAAGLLKAALLLHGRRDAAAALETYRQVAQAHPRSIAARDGVAQLLVQLGKIDEARTQLAEMQKLAPKRPETLMLQAQLAYAADDFAAARELTSQLLGVAPNHLQVLLLAAATEMRTQRWSQAQSMLARLLKSYPGHVMGRRMMAQSLLALGQADKAVEVLQPVVESPEADAETLTMAGSALLRAGDVQRARAVFQRAVKARPEDPSARTALAMMQMARGESGAGIANLQTAAEGDRASMADLVLVTALMSQNDPKGALAALDNLQRKDPGSALPDLLRGQVLVAQGDIAGAGSAYEQALKKDPRAFGAVAGLASLDLRADRADAARKRLADFAKAYPTDARAPLALARLERRMGAADATVVAALREAVKADPGMVAARVELVQTLQAQGDGAGALEAAREAAAAVPDHAVVIDLLGTAQLSAGDAQTAISTFKQLVTMQPRQVKPLLRMVDAQLAAKSAAGAADALRQAGALEPGNPAVLRGLALLASLEGRTQDALAHARKLQAMRPAASFGYIVEAEVARRAGNEALAAAAFRSALQREKSSDLAASLHAALLASGDRVAADRMSADWIRDNPKDMDFRYHMGSVAIRRGELAAAEAHFRAVVEVQPRHAPALNNIAWLMIKQGKPGAVAVAERANALMPDRPAVLDTLSLALQKEGRLQQAVELQKRAVQLEPRNGDYRLRLAELLIENGDKSRAREELRALQNRQDYGRQAEVAALLARL